MAKLVVLTKGFAGKSCELKAERTTVGRVDDNDFTISEPSVSSHHCEILLRGDQVFVKDLGSTNGTYVDDRKFGEGPVKPGQKLRLGQVELMIDDGSGVAAGGGKQTGSITPPPGGVKMGELEQGTKVVDSPFEKKSNKVNKIFLYGGIGAGAVIIGLLAYAVITLNR